MPPRKCMTCHVTRSPDAYSSAQARRCNPCKEAAPAPTPASQRRCTTCGATKPIADYPTPTGRKCAACHDAPAPPKTCARCGQDKPAAEFRKRGVRNCEACRATPLNLEPAPRACFRCFQVKPADAFPWGTGGTKQRRRSTVCTDCHAAEAGERAERERQRAAASSTFDVDGVPHRRCKKCAEVKPLVDGFYRSRRTKPGKPPQYAYTCKACQIAENTAYKRRTASDPEVRAARARRQRDWKARNPERARAAQRRYMERVKADPEWHARYREAQRMSERLRRERRDGVHAGDLRVLRAVQPEHDEVTVLTLQLARVIDAEAARDAVDDEAGGAGRLGIVTARCGISDRYVYAWRSGTRPRVGIGVADRVLTGLDLLWWDVWNEDTVRVPLVLAHLYRPHTKRSKRTGEPLTYWDRGERGYGDAGPDLAALAAIETAWEGDEDMEAEAA